MKKFICTLVALLFLGTTNIASAQDTTKASVRPQPTCPPCRLVWVLDKTTKNPIEDAEFIDSLSGSYMMTNSQGVANLEFTYRIGQNKFYVRKLGFKPEELVYNGLGKDSPDTLVTIELERVTTLAPSVTTGKFDVSKDAGQASGFLARCPQIALCFQTAELSASGLSLKEMLKNHRDLFKFTCEASSVRLRGRMPSSGVNQKTVCSVLMLNFNAQEWCAPRFYVDGHTISREEMDNFDNLYTASSFKGVEVFPATRNELIPQRFWDKCGSVVAWTTSAIYSGISK